ncbi:MAG: DUF58 domain-containing protein [bacterium]|nr:DUF58 domain-containing protein [bacterium]
MSQCHKVFELPPPQKQLAPLPHHSWFWRHTMALSLTGLALFLFLVATNTQSGWVYVIVACLAATLLLSYIIARSMLYKLTVTRQFEDDVRCGEETRITLTLHNASKSPKFGISIIEHLPQTLPDIAPQRRFYATYIPAKSTAKFTYSVKCRLRGYHQFTQVELESGFPLSLFFIKKRFSTSDWLCAAPQLLPLSSENHSSATSPYAIRHLIRRGQSDSFYGLREYIYGDDLRFVHWAASAHHRELLIKEFQDISSQKRLLIAIDPTRQEFLQTPQQEDLESALALAATLAEWCADLKVPCTLVTLRQGEIKTGDALSRQEFLASIQAEPPYNNPDELANWLQKEAADSPNCHIIYFSIPGTDQHTGSVRPFGPSREMRVVCAPSLSPPSLYLAFSLNKGQRQRHYLPLRNRFVPRDKRQLARKWKPFLTESYFEHNTLYLCGSKYLEEALSCIIRSLR